MKDRKIYVSIVILALMIVAVFAIYGCGGRVGYSSVSGTIADLDRSVIIGANVWVDSNPILQTESLVTGAYRLDSVRSGWQNIKAEAIVEGQKWVGTTAVDVLKDEPTMNVNIVMAPFTQTTTITGTVRNEDRRRVANARVFLTLRYVWPPEQTSAFDGAYGSIVAVTDRYGRYRMPDVPIGVNAIISASRVGYANREHDIITTSRDMVRDFTLARSSLSEGPIEPFLEAVEAYTMPDSLTVRSGNADAYQVIKAFASERYRKVLKERDQARDQEQIQTRAFSLDSLIEVDLYFNAFDLEDSRNIAGYGIYRTVPGINWTPIDFIRDPYANFYSDMGREINPYQTYYYSVTTVDVEYLDENNRPDPWAESDYSNTLEIAPLGQLKVTGPANSAFVSGNPVFHWNSLQGAESYRVFVYDRFPTKPLDPEVDYDHYPVGVYPIWTKQDINETFIEYNGPNLISGKTYYWVVLADKIFEVDNYGYYVRSAHSYSEIRHFRAE